MTDLKPEDQYLTVTTCFVCDHDLRGPYCPACNPDTDAARAEGVAPSSDTVKMPETADEAAAMALLGEAWLRANAPHRLRAEGVAALQQAGEPISRENLEAELRETIGLYVREAVTRMFSEENATYRCARQIAGMLQPGYYLHRKLFSSPLPQQTALVDYKGLVPHEPAACGASAPSEPPRDDGEGQA